MCQSGLNLKKKKGIPMKRIFNVLDAELTHINKLSDANRNT